MEAYTDLIKIYLLLHGHNLDYKILAIDEEMAEYIVQLSKLNYKVPNVKMNYIRRKRVLELGKEFYDTYFHVHDILYGTDRMVKKLNKQKFYDYKEALEAFNKLGKLISPYNLPVFFNQKDETEGYLRIMYVDVEDEEFLSAMKPHFSKICLARRATNLTSSSYIHELCHLQVESNKYSIEDCNNSEVFPIFLELVSLVDNNELLKYNVNKRVEFLIREFDKLIAFYFEKEKGIDVYQAFVTSKYIVSLIKALKLLVIYLESSIIRRREILESIQKVFDKKRTTEEILSSLDVSLDNCLDINIIKKLMR